MSTEAKVAAQYDSRNLAERLLSALRESGRAVDRLTADALFPFDQMHARQLAATREHMAHLGLDPSRHVLDVGSGIGGPSRYMAFTFGCRVTGLDLTESYVAAARELTERCGLSTLVDFRVGSALAMPFGDQAFDAATCQYVAMNISDKAALLREILRVLKPGGRLMFSAVVTGKGEPHFPVPWARDPSVSFLAAPDTLRRHFDEAGWRVLEWTDESELVRAALADPPQQEYRTMRTIVSGEDFPLRAQNFGRNIKEGAIGSVLALAERP